MVSVCLFGLYACGGGTAEKAETKPKAEKPQQATKNTIYDDPTSISYSPEEGAVMQRLNELLAQSSKCEYVFYLPGYSMSTEIADPKQVRNCVYYVANKEAPNQDCDMEVGMAIRSAETDEIHITIDAVVTKPECAMAKVTFDGKTHNMSMTSIGVKHVMQFLSMKPGQGTPANK